MEPAILLVEDDPELRLILCAVFRSAGFTTLCAANGRAAVKLIEAHSPDLVVTDILMPAQEGIQTIMILKARARPPKIIAMSGGGRFGETTVLEWAQRLGADATLAKPFAPSTLVLLANALLQRADAAAPAGAEPLPGAARHTPSDSFQPDQGAIQ